MTSLENKDNKSLNSDFRQKYTQKKGEEKMGKKFIEFKDIDEATEASIYYGFSPIPTPVIEKIDFERGEDLLKENSASPDRTFTSQMDIPVEEKNFLLRHYLENNLIAEPQPIMLSYKNSGLLNKKNKISSKYHYMNLHILGSSKSIAEAVLIKTASDILSDNGIKEICIDINSIGDKESTNKFVRELVSYYRKNINKMSAHCRQLFKKDSFSLLECDDKDCCKELNEQAPKSISYLSESSREHFKEVLEGLEILNIPYRINNHLIPNKLHSSHTAFQLITGNENKKEVVAFGGRYDGLAKKIGFKKDIPAVGLKIFSKNIHVNKSINSKIKLPSFFFLQLGFEAKLKSLNVIEILRKSKILVSQSLSRDMLGGQIALAEKMKMPYTIIMGKKESMENTVMVRDMNTRSQEIIPLYNLSDYLKKLKT